jgi:hypothetical protein
MHIVKSVGVLSVAKIMGLVYGCLALLVVPVLLIGGFAGMFASSNKAAFPFAGVIGIVFAIFVPFLYGAIGFVAGAISALIYNVVAKWVGGFELELTLQPMDFTVQRPLVPPPPPSI